MHKLNMLNVKYFDQNNLPKELGDKAVVLARCKQTEQYNLHSGMQTLQRT